MVWNIQENNGTYILRYYLPCMPQYDKTVTDIRNKELIEFYIDNAVDCVMLYVDLNPYWCYMSDTLEHTEYLIEALKETIENLRMNNISCQLNY